MKSNQKFTGYHFHNILRLFNVLLNFPVTTSELTLTLYTRVPSRAANRFKI